MRYSTYVFVAQITPDQQIKMHCPSNCSYAILWKKILQILANIFHHGATENMPIFAANLLTWSFRYGQFAQMIWSWYLENWRFFLMVNFWWSFLCFLYWLKTNNWPPKLHIRKKFTIFEISTPNFLCMLPIHKTFNMVIFVQF